MKYVQQAIQLHNAVDSIVQRERERPVIAKELELRRQKAQQGLALSPLRFETEHQSLEIRNLENRHKRSELIEAGVASGTIDFNPKFAKMLHEGSAFQNGVQSLFGAMREGDAAQIETSIGELVKEMESQGFDENRKSAVLQTLGDLQIAQMGPNGEKVAKANALTPEKLVRAVFQDWDRAEEPDAFEFSESEQQLITGIVGRANEFLEREADDADQPLRQKRVNAFSQALIGALVANPTLDDEGALERGTLSGQQMVIAKGAAQEYTAGIARETSGTFVELQSQHMQAISEAVMQSGDGPQIASMGDNEIYRIVQDTLFDNHPDYDAAMWEMMTTSGQFDEVALVQQFGGIDLNREVLEGRIDPSSPQAREIVGKAILREWQRRVIERDGDGARHAVQGLGMAYKRLSDGDFPESNTAIGGVLELAYQKWAGNAVVKQQEARELTPLQQEHTRNSLIQNDRLPIWESGNSSTPYTYAPMGTTPGAQALAFQVAAKFQNGEALSAFPSEAMQKMMGDDKNIGITAFNPKTFFEARSMNLSPGDNDSLAQIDAFVAKRAEVEGTRTVHGQRLNRISKGLRYIRERGGERSFDPEHRRWAAGGGGFQIGVEAERFETATGLPAERAAKVMPLLEELHALGFQHDLAVATQSATWREDVNTLRKQYLLVNIELYKAMDIDLRDVVAGPRRDEPVFKIGVETQVAASLAQAQGQMPQEEEEERPARVPKGLSPRPRRFTTRMGMN